jgi:hypothetical protein
VATRDGRQAAGEKTAAGRTWVARGSFAASGSSTPPGEMIKRVGFGGGAG